MAGGRHKKLRRTDLDDEARGEDGLVLPDAVRAVDGLHLRRGGPPRVHYG